GARGGGGGRWHRPLPSSRGRRWRRPLLWHPCGGAGWTAAAARRSRPRRPGRAGAAAAAGAGRAAAWSAAGPGRGRSSAGAQHHRAGPVKPARGPSEAVRAAGEAQMTIRVLAPPVADAIAAGEVVERPASVVKELLENSLDAGARHITVEVRGAGRTLIRVADDGAGIPPVELRLAFRRHATSKVATLDDLGAIMSLGFRGEALASVAAVSDVEARSGGGRVRLRAAEVVEEGASIPVPGTAVEVRDLFATTPA